MRRVRRARDAVAVEAVVGRELRRHRRRELGAVVGCELRRHRQTPRASRIAAARSLRLNLRATHAMPKAAKAAPPPPSPTRKPLTAYYWFVEHARAPEGEAGPSSFRPTMKEGAR